MASKSRYLRTSFMYSKKITNLEAEFLKKIYLIYVHVYPGMPENNSPKLFSQARECSKVSLLR